MLSILLGHLKISRGGNQKKKIIFVVVVTTLRKTRPVHCSWIFCRRLPLPWLNLLFILVGWRSYEVQVAKELTFIFAKFSPCSKDGILQKKKRNFAEQTSCCTPFKLCSGRDNSSSQIFSCNSLVFMLVTRLSGNDWAEWSSLEVMNSSHIKGQSD